MLNALDHLEEWLIATLMAAATLIIFVAVLHRYALGIPLLYPYFFPYDTTWAKELCIYLFVWMAKFGAAYGVRTGVHVGVDVLVNKLPPAFGRRVVLAGLLGGVLFTAVVAYLGGTFVWHIGHTDQVSSDLEAPMWLVYLCIPLGSSLMCFRFLQVAWRFFHGGELPHHDETYVEGLEDDAPQLDLKEAGGRS